MDLVLLISRSSCGISCNCGRSIGSRVMLDPGKFPPKPWKSSFADGPASVSLARFAEVSEIVGFCSSGMS